MKNEKIYNKCKTDLILGFQLEKMNTTYNLGYSLNAASNIGNRENQEDSVIILEHEKNKEIKLLAVADGVGGREGSEQASSYLLQQLSMEFDMLPVKYYENIELIKEHFSSAISKINETIIKNNLGQTTLSMAIVLKNKTIIFNIGDSRIYTYKKNRLKQETRDDSLVQELYEQGEIPTKDMMRFHQKSNVINNCVGIKEMKINTKAIKNNYELLMAATDGVTDFLSENEIGNTIKISKNKNISEQIVKKAIKNVSRSNYIGEYYREKSNHDNATAATLIRKR